MTNKNNKILNSEGMNTETPDIILAALDGNSKLVDDLLSDGTDINTVDPVRGFACLHIGCMHGDDALVDVLLKHHRAHGGLDFTLKSYEPERLAWQLAMSFHHYELARRVDSAGQQSAKPGGRDGPKLV